MRRHLLLLLMPVLLVACGGASPAGQTSTPSNQHTTLNLVAYSTPKPVIQALVKQWTGTAAGRGVTFTQSYGSSGSQSRAVAAGQPCDIAFLSTGLDINTLADAGLVANNWSSTLSHGGTAAD